MRKRNYTQVQALLPEIKVMLSEGKTQQEVAEQAYEIQRLQMENKLLRDFLHCTGRK